MDFCAIFLKELFILMYARKYLSRHVRVCMCVYVCLLKVVLNEDVYHAPKSYIDSMYFGSPRLIKSILNIIKMNKDLFSLNS